MIKRSNSLDDMTAMFPSYEEEVNNFNVDTNHNQAD